MDINGATEQEADNELSASDVPTYITLPLNYIKYTLQAVSFSFITGYETIPGQEHNKQLFTLTIFVTILMH